MISPPAPAKAFREYALLWHEIGNEQVEPGVGPYDKNGVPLPTIDKHTGAYRPGSRAINYRSEPFMNRLDKDDDESQAYGSYTFGDPATPTPRAYLSDPTKFRIVHAGSEMFHVFHMHGGGIRWRFNPAADKTFDYQKTGLDKSPKAQLSPSTRLDSQATGPGESYNLEIEGGAGGVQQAAGEFLFHCHIASHYVSGMWAFWRVYDTNQPGFAALAGSRAARELGHIGRPDRAHDARRHDDHGRQSGRLDPPAAPDAGRPAEQPGRLGLELEGRQLRPRRRPCTWASPRTRPPGRTTTTLMPGHPTAYPGDVFKTLPGETVARPVIQFDPRQRAHLVPAACERTSASGRRSRRTATRAHPGSERRATSRHRAPAHRRGPGAATASARRARPFATSTSSSLDGLRLQVTRQAPSIRTARCSCSHMTSTTCSPAASRSSRSRSAPTSATAWQ